MKNNKDKSRTLIYKSKGKSVLIEPIFNSHKICFDFEQKETEVNSKPKINQIKNRNKNRIKKEKIKNKKLSNKYLNLSKKIKMMENIVKNMEEYNYKLSLSAFRDRKVDIPIKKQLNALSGRNRQIINHKFNFEDKLNNFEQNNFKDDNNNINNK